MLPELTGHQRPRWSAVPQGPRLDYSVGVKVLKLGKAMGMPLYDWQVVRILTLFARRPFPGARTADGQRWAAFQLVDLIPRQNGKNEWISLAQIGKLFVCKVRMQRHTAHNLETAEDAYSRAKELIEDCDMLMERKPKFRQANSKASIQIEDVGRIDYRTRSNNAGRGLTKCGVLWLDEAFNIKQAFMASVLPILSANPDAQMVLTSSPVLEGMDGMEHGIVLARVRKRAQEVADAIENGEPEAAIDERLAAWEHSVDEAAVRANRELIYDMDFVKTGNPGWDHIDQAVVREEATVMSFEQYLAERCGVGIYPDPDLANGHVIQRDVLEQTWDRESQPVGAVVIYVAASPDREWASIAIAGWREDGRAHVEVIDRRQGTAWLPARLVGLVAKWEIAGIGAGSPAIFMDSRDAVTTVKTDIVALAIKQDVELTIEETDAQDAADFYGKFYDALTGKVPDEDDDRDELERLLDEDDKVDDEPLDPQPIRHLMQDELADAVAAASTRKLGDGTAWDSRTSDDDISALRAMTGAYGVLRTKAVRGWLEDNDLEILD